MLASVKPIALASDHAGYELKEHLKAYLKKRRIPVRDFGTDSLDSCDYPDFIIPAARAVSRGACAKAVLVCWTGSGSVMTANKVRGVRAAVVFNSAGARLSRKHNDANAIVFGSLFTKPGEATRLLKIWLAQDFEGGRHLRRVRKIHAPEKRK